MWRGSLRAHRELEHSLERHLEHRGDAKRDLERRRVLTEFDRVHGLACDPDRDDPGMRLARAQRLTGRETELGRDEARSAVRGRGVPGGSHVRPTRTTETGSRDARPLTSRHLVLGTSRPPGAVLATAELVPIQRENRGEPPERSRSASIGRTGWRWGQAPANPSRTSTSEQRRMRESRITPGISRFRIFDRLGGVVEPARPRVTAATGAGLVMGRSRIQSRGLGRVPVRKHRIDRLPVWSCSMTNSPRL